MKSFTTAVSSSSSQVPAIPSSNRGSDSSALLITGHKLNGHNYLQWSHLVMMFICDKRKDDYITGGAPKPNSTDSKYKAWKAENNMVLS